MLKYIIDRLLLGGYETAKLAGIARIFARYSRGNTALQNARVLNEARLRALKARGDAGAARLARAERRWAKKSPKVRASA